MTKEEFCEYVMNSLVPLYPDACDEPGKRVMIKVDSGPGRLKEMVSGEPRILRYYYKLLVCLNH